MKTQLTKEQSQHLIDLGVSIYLASGLSVEYEKEFTNYINIFTLTDLLEILPKEIFDESLYNQNYMVIEYTAIKWHVGYGHIIPYEGYFFLKDKFSKELIDALYELLCWVIENKYIKI